jgi:hypothetical protein
MSFENNIITCTYQLGYVCYRLLVSWPFGISLQALEGGHLHIYLVSLGIPRMNFFHGMSISICLQNRVGCYLLSIFLCPLDDWSFFSIGKELYSLACIAPCVHISTGFIIYNFAAFMLCLSFSFYHEAFVLRYLVNDRSFHSVYN